MSKLITEGFQKWLNTILIVIVGFLIKNKLEDIDAKMDLVQSIQINQAVVINRVDNLESDHNQLKGAFYAHIRIDDAKAEEEISLDKLKKK